MFAISWQVDEWLLVLGVSLLVTRLFIGLGRIVYSLWKDVDYTPELFTPKTTGGQDSNLMFVTVSMTILGSAALALALASFWTGGPPQEVRAFVYALCLSAGIFVGVLLEARIAVWCISLWFFLAGLGFKLGKYRADLQSEDTQTRVNAARGLSRLMIKARPAVPELLVAMRDESAEVRALAAVALLSARPEIETTVESAARAALADPDMRVRTAAAAMLARIPETNADELMPIFHEGLKHQDTHTALIALQGFASLGPRAASACAAIGDAVLLPSCGGSCLASASSGVLAAIGPPALPALIKLLERGDYTVMVSAIWALGEIGEPARDALPLLQTISRQSPFFKKWQWRRFAK